MAGFFANGNQLLPSTPLYAVRIFNIPAISVRDDQGNINKACPNICVEAPEICKEICYAYRRQKGREKIVYGGREKNYWATRCDNFVEKVQKQIQGTIRYYKNRAQDIQIIYRIHESGDFYSVDYLQKWVAIANHFQDQKHVHFMAYTKSIEILNQFLVKNGCNLQDINIKFMYSIMRIKKHDGKLYENTLDQPRKMEIAKALSKQGLRYYTVYEKEDDLPQETETLKICRLHEGRTCNECGMKCYLDDCDIAAVAR